MNTWFDYLKQGLSRRATEDRLHRGAGDKGVRVNLGNLKPFVARHWLKGLFGGLLILISTLLAFPQPLLNRYLVDDVILSQQLSLLPWVIGLMIGVKLFGMLSDTLQQFYFTRFEQQVLLDIQEDLFHRVLRFPKSFFDEEETGYLMSRLSSDVRGLRWFFSNTLVYILTNVLRFLGGIGLLFYLEWRLAIAALVLIPGIVLLMRYFAAKYRTLSREGMEQDANVSRQIQESLSATSLIKAFSSEKRETKRIVSELKESFQISLERVTVGSAANLVIGSLGDIAKVVVLAAGATWVITGEWTLGSLLAFQSYLGYVYGPAQYLASANLQFQNAEAALERVSSLFSIVPEEDEERGIQVEKLEGEIEFRGVDFSYGEGDAVLEDVNCTIQPGEHVAIVGPSGVGKTTLVSLILRFYTPNRGEIYFDGVAASEYQLSSLRQRIGYVSQSTLLLSGTVEENLRYGNPDASEGEIVEAAKVAGIHDFIAILPQGYGSKIGEGGVNLSEGQKQRLAIARALIKSPDIVVLDEPTSALDSVVERTIFDRLPEVLREKTTFIVAHRLATIQNSERIMLLNERRLVAMGTHRELLEQNAYYQNLVRNQQIIS